jgi:membrane protease YdiL (CAAX protease family)
MPKYSGARNTIRPGEVCASMRSLFQFGYTTIFGWYATFVYLRTGSLLAVVVIHSELEERPQ